MIGDRIESAVSWTLLITLVVWLSACASLTSPETPAQRLAYVDGQFTAMVDTAADLREQGVIDAEDAKKIDPIIQRGNEALTAAWAAIGQDRPQDALDYLETVNRLLTRLSEHLQEARNDDR